MHDWAEEDVDWKGLEDVAEFIAINLIKYYRIPVVQWKEKFGTVRVYCSFGWSTLYSIWRPQYQWVSKRWPYRLDLFISYNLGFIDFLNQWIIPWQKIGYRRIYKEAIKRYPHLKSEILEGADWIEELRGL